MTSGPEMRSLFNCLKGDAFACDFDPCRVTLHIIADPHEVRPLIDLYHHVVNWFDPDLKLFRITERAIEHPKESRLGHVVADLPALAVMIFLKGQDSDSGIDDGSIHSLQQAQHLFKFPPWRFHHNDSLDHGRIALANNSQEFFYTSVDLPLWGIRHVHYGREHLRFVLYVPDTSWSDQLQFYRLVLGLEPELLKDDFCLFTVYQRDDYDVQFSLKKINQGAQVRTLDCVHIQVKVRDIGQLVPLFPNVCRPISDVKWQTNDHDGNVVVLDVIDKAFEPAHLKSVHTHNLLNVVRTNDNRYVSCHVRSEQLTNSANARETGSVPISSGLSDLSLTSGSTGMTCYRQYSDQLMQSDSDELEIDLPSPTFRVSSFQEEDEASLTLTNTSEESGIQMHHGSEDLSFCDDEPLRPCLNKNTPFKLRHAKLKVRFKEEVEEFEDDSCSRISSGIESDAEMETRFPYVPPNKCPVNYGKTFSSQSITGHYQTIASNPFPVSISQIPSTPQVCQNRLNANKNDVKTPENNASSSINSSYSTKSYPAFPTPEMTRDSRECKSSARHNYSPGVMRGEKQLPGNGDRQSERYEYSQPPNTNFQSSHGVCLKHHHAPSSANGAGRCVDEKPIPLPSSLTNEILEQNRSSPQSPTQTTPTSKQSRHSRELLRQGQLQERNPSHTPYGQRRRSKSKDTNTSSKAPVPPHPPVRDSETRLQTVLVRKDKPPARLPREDFPLPEFRDKSGPKGLHFPRSRSLPSTNESTAPVFSDDEETTLKFTLKFDTCPTSGLTSRQEQIGFYV